MAGPNTGVQYLKSGPAVLKILEIILLVICIGSVGYFWDNWVWKDVDFERNDYIKNFIYATAAAGVLALLFFLVFVAGLHQRINVLVKIAAAIFILLAILLFVVSGFLADNFKYYKDKKICKTWEILKVDSQCEQLLAGTVCGFVAGLIFLVDGIVHCKL